ncbi:DUF6538 domain-containing protein [Hansschlegelia beijingensis]|uniref:DUF6538 domain-containing protein n=1 Tax=Hansschlegelia beijingensis TaxID=1133344 RepID=UPI00387F351E
MAQEPLGSSVPAGESSREVGHSPGSQAWVTRLNRRRNTLNARLKRRRSPMGRVSNLARRGAVYYWRRRLPAEIACRIGKSHLEISLRTMDSRIARFRGAQMSALAERLFAMPISAILTKQQASDLFTAAFTMHLVKMMQLREIDRADGRNLENIAELERARGHAYLMLSEFGAAPSSGERQHLLSRGLSEPGADRALQQLEELRTITASATSVGRIQKLLSTIGAEPNARNVTASKNIYYRALGEALIRSADMVNLDLPYDDLVAEAVAALLEEGAPIDRAGELAATSPRTPSPAPSNVANAQDTNRSAAVGPTIVALGDRLCANKQGDDHHWTPKTASQARSIFNLLQRFMSESHGSDRIADLRQDRLAAFDVLLRRTLPKTYGKSPHDKLRTIREFEDSAKGPQSAERGLEIGTRNRHWTFIGQLIEFAKSSGETVDERLDASKFHQRQNKPARRQRPVPKEDAVAGLFGSTIYTGYAHWRRLAKPGPLVLHRAAYWVPIILAYSGMRRDEACGLAVDDVGFVDGAAYFMVRGNKFRRLKNEVSERNILAHPELIRLGFVGYVEKIRAVGHELLFPDLYSASSRGQLGDRFYKEIASVIKKYAASPHGYRHFFNDQLKKAGVAEEFRQDLMGHTGRSETTNRYCDPIEVMKQRKLLEKLPTLTKHLKPVEVQLLDWVANREAAPWAKASRRAALLRA